MQGLLLTIGACVGVGVSGSDGAKDWPTLGACMGDVGCTLPVPHGRSELGACVGLAVNWRLRVTW